MSLRENLKNPDTSDGQCGKITQNIQHFEMFAAEILGQASVLRIWRFHSGSVLMDFEEPSLHGIF